MAIRTYKVTLDSKNTLAPEPVYLRQGDKTGAVVIDATLMDNGSPVSLSGLTPMFKANTADGQAVIADSTGFNIVNASSGEFTYQVPSQLGSVDGKIKIAYFSFSDSSGAQSTFDVAFIVKKAADMTQDSAQDWVSNLNEIISQYNNWANNAHSSWQDFVNKNKEIIESIDPGGTLLAEIIAARNGKSNLKTRLDNEHAQVTAQLAQIAINVSAYGIVGDGQTIVTDDLNNLIYNHRGHKIFIPDGIYIIDDSIFLYDDTPVELSSNAVLKFAAGAVSVRDKQNEYEGKHMIKAHKTLGTKNVEMYGGTIDGNAETQAKDAHRGIFLEGVDGLSIHDIKIKNVSGWGIAHINCTNFHFYNIEFDQPSEELHGYNGDGITGMSSNGLIENISGYVSDDLVALQAGNTIFSPQSNANNVTINGLYPKKKDGRDEYAYRALGLYAYDGFELDNIVINNVRGVSEHEILISTPYYTQDSVKGKFGTIKLSDVDMKFKGHELMAFKILNVNVETLILDTLIFKDLDQPQISALKIENATVNRIVLDKFYCNKLIGDQPFIDDGGEVKRIELLNSYFNNDDIQKSGYIYAKNSNKTTVTEIIARNLSGNVGALMRGIKDSDKVRVVSSDFITQEALVTNPINGDMILTDQGMKVYKQNRFSALGDGYNILLITSESYTLRDLCSTILVPGSLTKVEITLHSDIEKFNWEFKLSVPENCIVTFKNGSGQNIFTGSVFDNGVYSIVRFGNSWLMSKISNSRFLTT